MRAGPRLLIAGVLVLALAHGSAAQTLSDVVGPLMVPVTEGRGPAERVTGFTAAPDAARQHLPDDELAALGRALVTDGHAADSEAALALGIQVFGDTQGVFAALGTLAEHALWLDQFGSINTSLNNLGLVFALAQVARDAANGNDAAALTGGIKAWMNYAISRWGWGSVQIGGVAIFVVDIVLRQWQSGLTEIATDLWTCRYKAWYQEHPRSIGAWKQKAWELYLAAEGDAQRPYGTYIDGVLNEYVGRAFDDPEIATYGECGGSSFGGRDYVEKLIEAEHKVVLEKMLADQVMPEVADRAWARDLRGRIVWANTHLMPRLNSEVTLEITAYGVNGPARVVMPLPAGGEWGGTLRPEGTFKAKLTRFAVMKAGFPDRVQLHTEAGVEERRLTLRAIG